MMPAVAREMSTTVSRAPLYRAFFRTAIGMVLTLGAGWGAYLLLRIALAGRFTGVGIHEINAHGHAQIFGWVGLFVMGFAYFALPRMKQTDLVLPGLARASLWLMAGGVLVRTFSEAVAGWSPRLGAVGLIGGLAEVVAIAICLTLVSRSLRRAAAGLTVPDAYVMAGLGWFLVQAVYETVYYAATLRASDDALLALIATWQGPLREIQIHGFATLVILGVSQQLLPRLYGLSVAGPRKSAACLAAINLALTGIVTGLVLMRAAGHGWAGLWYLSVLVLAGAVVSLVASWRLPRKTSRSDPSLKYVRAAYGWLVLSLAMLVLLPAHQFGLLPWLAPQSHAAEIGFSHAYYGAIRHAVTVGFISLMIVGISSRMVPEFVGIPPARLRPLWLPFLLINVGCLIRVTGQTWTDFNAVAFPVAAVSGLLEWSGLAVWGVHLWRLMNRPASSAFLVHEA